MQIRRAAIEDIDSIYRIESQVMPNPWTKKSLLEAIESDHTLFIVAQFERVIVGYAIVYYSQYEAQMPDIVVDTDFQKKGVGKKLIRCLFDELRVLGSPVLFLEVRESNQPAIGLYTQFGFEKIGIRKNFYTNPNENAICMKKDIP